MQFQAPSAAASHYQSRFVVSPPRNNQRYYSPQPQNIFSNQIPFTRNQQKVNSRLLSPQINSYQIPQIINNGNNGNNFNNRREVDLNISNNNHNNGTFNPAYYPNNHFPISQNLQYANNNSIGIIGSRQMLGPQFANMGGEYIYNSSQFGYPPSPSFVGLRNNLGPPQSYIPIKPPSTNLINQQIKFNLQQDKVHCVICQNDYYLSDHQEHIKIHKRNKQNPANRTIKKLANSYKKSHQQPKTRPIVEPEEYNIQYNPNSFVLQKETSFSTPTFVRPTFNDCSVGTSEIEINTKSNSPTVIPVLNSQPMTLKDKSIPSIPSGFPIKQHSVRFSRDTFISDKPSQVIKTFPITTQRFTIRHQSVNIIPAQINLTPPNPVYEKVQLSQDHDQNLDKLDPSAFKSGARYQRKYIPINETIQNSHAHQNLITPHFVQNSVHKQASLNKSQQNNQIPNQFSLRNPNQVEMSKKSVKSQAPIINQLKQPSEVSYSYSQPPQNIQESNNNFYQLSDVHTSRTPTQKILNNQQPYYFNQKRSVQDSKLSKLPQEPIFGQPIQINNNQQSKYNVLSSDRSMTYTYQQPQSFSQPYSIFQQNTPDFHKKKRLPKSFGGLNS